MKIRQLEWHDPLNSERPSWAQTAFGKYFAFSDGFWSRQKDSGMTDAGCAKAACQADFERRVRECVEEEDNDAPVGQERLKDAPKFTEKDIQAFLEEDPK